MKYQSASTKVADAYRGGVKLEKSWQACLPKPSSFFARSIILTPSRTWLPASRMCFGENVLICGGTGDGIYETGGVANHGGSPWLI